MRHGGDGLAAESVTRRQTEREPTTASANVRTLLKRATQGLHDDVERHLDLNRPRWTAESYRRLLERFLGIYFPLEQLLDRVNWMDSGIVFSARRKVHWLEADLVHFGLQPAALGDLDLCRNLPRLDDMVSGLGALYVLEGSTLGGQVILRNLRPQLGLSPETGGRFFSSYGADVGAMWRGFLAVLEQHGGEAAAEQAIVRGAVETFSAFARWFDASGSSSHADTRYADV